MAVRSVPNRLLEMAEGIFEALDSAGLGISVTVDPDGQRVFGNKALAELAGYGLEEIPPRLRFAPMEHERLDAMKRALLAGDDVPRLFRTRIVHKEGHEVPVEVAFALTDWDDKTGVVAFFRDISSRVAMAQELSASERRFRDLVETAPDAVVVSVKGVVKYANPASVAILRLDSVDDLLGRSLASIVDEAELPLMMERIARVMQGETIGPSVYSARRADGDEFQIEISSSIIEWEGELALLGYGRDVTARQRVQAELIEADRMASVGLLAAGVAHEINNPLTYTLLHLAKLKRTLPGLIADEEVRASVARTLDQAIDGGDRVGTIVRDLLSFVHGRDGGVDAVDVMSVLDSALKLAHTAIDSKAVIERRFEYVPPVRGNEARLGQVFVNLIVNALQSMSHKPAPERELLAEVDLYEGRVRIRVSDRGIGIDPDVAERIFDPFFTTKEVGVGTGLGLSISRSIIDGIGGSILAGSREGGGTTVTVCLPASAAIGRRRRESAARRATQARVLVVDDDALVLDAVSDLLAQRYQVECSPSGREALDRILDAGDFDAILCDLSMPDIDGIALFDAVREARPELESRFLFLSGGIRDSRQRKFASENGERILSKPIELEQVFDAIDGALES